MTSSPVPESRPSIRHKVYLESRYRKLLRGLPQTIFYCPECKGDKHRRKSCKHCEGFGKLTKDSVQELIGRRLLPAFKAKNGKFHGAGREDRDVLMLGKGRPFVYEVIGARVLDVDLDALRVEIEERAEGAIELQPFKRVRRERIPYWKEAHFDKVYRAEVTLSDPVGDEKLAELRGWSGEVRQRTPQRVAHRRADLQRERRVEVQGLQRLGDDRVEVRVLCAHGTYVKEWISGDDDRTRPSLAELLRVACRCEVLDVEEVLTEGAD